MKNAQWALLVVTGAFLCLILGIFIGRNISGNYLYLSPSETAVPTQVSTAEKGKLNINTATVEELTMLPGIGETIAERIVAYRMENGPFTAPEDLLNVEDIGPVRLSKICDYITIGE